jgi:hypothetical protein
MPGSQIAEWLAPVVEACVGSDAERLARALGSADRSGRRGKLNELLAALRPAAIWALPFPMGVFGTLRAGCRNHALMLAQPVGKRQRAFLPQFAAREIGLHHRPGATAPFEVYGYSASHWQALIPAVDELEEFRPGRIDPTVYHRTLAWLYLLPGQFEHPLYDLAMLPHERDLQIDVRSWGAYEPIPCWIYSGIAQNQLAAAHADSPIIWDGTGPR